MSRSPQSVRRNIHAAPEVGPLLIVQWRSSAGADRLTTAFGRRRGSAAFTRRDARAAELLLTELGPVVCNVVDAQPLSLETATAPDLTPRQRQVLDLLLDGQSEKEIARRIDRSQNTVHGHVTALYRHYGVSTRAELLSRFIAGETDDSTPSGPAERPQTPDADPPV